MITPVYTPTSGLTSVKENDNERQASFFLNQAQSVYGFIGYITVGKWNYSTKLIPYFATCKFLQFHDLIVIALGDKYSNYGKLVK